MNNISYLIILLPTMFFVYIASVYAEYAGGFNCFYGIKINELSLNEEDKVSIRNKYKKSIRIITLIMLLASIFAIYTFDKNFEKVMNIILFVYAGSIMLFQFITYSKVKKLRCILGKNIDNEKDIIQNKIKTIDTILLSEKSKIQNKFSIIFLILLFISAASIFYLASIYNELPRLIPPNFIENPSETDFVVKSLKNVFGLELAGFIMVTLLGFIAVSSIGNINSIRKDKLENEKKRVIKYINKMGKSFVLIALCIEYQTTIIPIILLNQYKFPLYTIIFAWFLIMANIINVLYSYVMLSSFKFKEKFNYSDDYSKWVFGYFYFNKEDPSFIVDRKIGMGYTVNLANPKINTLIAIVLLLFVMDITLKI
ncbi:DUF5808 domain-containing protein [Clostridium sp. CCUG 7971]|uniref:DUF5808 domain-containing protein n=1 Tax=Clostridium sp. CCUG 7971 TaxID=2811414 RepID=UPI001ABB4807|nr:DUF5808 domain-containing protein [Clostridium sp. CCUG 7971]MBO3445962.1 hypothetical protein [Clostridium sp. CCUG 7971]